MVKLSANNTANIQFVEQGSDPATPAAGKRRIYAKGDGFYEIDDAGAVTGPFGVAGSGTVDIEDEGSAEGAADTIDFTGAGVSVTFAAGTATVDIPGGGGGSDLVQTKAGAGSVRIHGMIANADKTPASPNANDDEFDTTDSSDPMTGWTTLGTPTQHDMNTTVLSHYYLRKTAATLGLHGIYKACPSFPFTVTAKIADYAVIGGNARAGIIVAEATPGKLLSLAFSGNSSGPSLVIADIWTNRTTYGSTPVTAVLEYGAKYLRMVVTSSTAVQCYFSLEGNVWWTFGGSINPSMTIGSVGIMVDPHTSGQDAQLACDWIRFT